MCQIDISGFEVENNDANLLKTGPFMSWPTPQDYNEAIQTPALSLSDDELADGEAETNHIGLPKAVTGAFASVYKIKCANRDLAVRCFLHNIPDQRERYKALSAFLIQHPLKFMADFEYQEKGIKIHDQWFPILKMEWVEGQSLEHYIGSHIGQKFALENIIQEFLSIYQTLRSVGIAHGDLQHGNVLVVTDEKQGTRLRLVDYDGMFVPSLNSYLSNELGHPNYQHPRRRSKHFGSYLDNFSAWVIHASLNCLLHDPALWSKLSGGDDCLLFRRTDFRNPSGAVVFNLLEKHDNPLVRNTGALLARLVDYPLPQVPVLDPALQSPHDLVAPMLTAEDEQDMLQEEESDSIRLGSIEDLPEWTRDQAGASADDRTTRSGPWPGTKHYAEAVAAANRNFSDPELANAVPSVFDAAVGPDGMVFYMRCLTRHLAVKCFFRHVPDRHERYEAAARALGGNLKKYFVEFEYQPEGLRVGKYWYPILKMEWAYGMSLAQCAENYKDDPDFVASLQQKFQAMMWDLSTAGIAHGDLQPSNILISNNTFKLLDYDGIYVPELAGRQSIEVGHIHYQHPDRGLEHFGPNIDNYSAWVIDTCFLLMQLDHACWEIIDERLQYCREDAEWAFHLMGRHRERELRDRARLLAQFMKGRFEDIPPLGDEPVIHRPNTTEERGVLQSIKRLFKRQE